MIVYTNELPKELLDKLPISFKLSEKFDTRLLKDPLLRTEVEKYASTTVFQSQEITQTNINEILDFIPAKDKYGIKYVENEDEFIILNIRNFFRIMRGAYIFSPEIGTEIYEYVKYLDTPTVKESIYEEVSEFVTSLVSQFNLKSDVKILGIDFEHNNNTAPQSVEYRIKVYIQINNQVYEIENEL